MKACAASDAEADDDAWAVAAWEVELMSSLAEEEGVFDEKTLDHDGFVSQKHEEELTCSAAAAPCDQVATRSCEEEEEAV